MLLASLALASGLGASAALGSDADLYEPEVIELTPDSRAGWSLRNVFAPITGLFLGGPGYWYGDRVLEVESTPPGALVDLFYIRNNFQKRYEQAETPVRVILPRRIEAGPRDAVNVRALLEGYRQQSETVRVTSRRKRIHFELAPLPNTLVAVSHRYLAGRATLEFLTKEALTFRLQEAADGFNVVLTETGRSPEAASALDAMASPLIAEVVSRQLGEDLVVNVELEDEIRERGFEPRSRQGYDPARDLHRFGLDLVPADGGAEAVQRAREALASLRPADVSGCALEFEETLRSGLEAASLSRALAPSGEFTDPYFRAAMRRLGEVSAGGTVEFADGSRYRPSVPIELEAAVTHASSARGYLALLHAFVEALEPAEHHAEVFRGLVAPESEPAEFRALLKAAERREAACRTGGDRSAAGPAARPLAAR